MNLLAILVLATAALLGAWMIIGEIRLGQVSIKSDSVFTRADEPGGFWCAVVMKCAFVVFAVAVLLHLTGLIGDPVAWLRETFPAFFRHH